MPAFDHTSRYYTLPTATTTLPDGRVVVHLTRRFVPDRRDAPLLTEVVITEGERLDLVTARTLGDPLQFWRICDSNSELSPFALVAVIGRRVRVTVPQA
jgi:hypothetical protein